MKDKLETESAHRIGSSDVLGVIVDFGSFGMTRTIKPEKSHRNDKSSIMLKDENQTLVTLDASRFCQELLDGRFGNTFHRQNPDSKSQETVIFRGYGLGSDHARESVRMECLKRTPLFYRAGRRVSTWIRNMRARFSYSRMAMTPNEKS